jgi:hypothetical protein
VQTIRHFAIEDKSKKAIREVFSLDEFFGVYGMFLKIIKENNPPKIILIYYKFH